MSRSAFSKQRVVKAQAQKRRLRIVLGVCSVIIVSAVTLIILHERGTPTAAAGPVSRQILLLSESHIKALKPGPTIGALDYAYIASAYDDTLRATDQSNAVAVVRQVMDILFPTRVNLVDSQVDAIATANKLRVLHSPTQFNPKANTILTAYKHRYATDNHILVWDGIIPTGPDKWVQKTTLPVTPRAGEWQRWLVTHAITVPPPPLYGSEEDSRQLALVRQAVAKRNGQDINLINFWAGQPGSETPGGIWQNVLYDKVQGDVSKKAITADIQYAYVQRVLAQTISDAFMECWKAKFTYWTARPDMRMPGLSTAMNDPTFPGYISGHSTVSKAAADVLSVIVPAYSTTWQQDADQARYSRLVAGIHFDIDNAVGFDVGSAVAQQAIHNQHLRKVL